MSKTGKGTGLEAQLRQAIVESGISQRRLAALAGIHQPQLSWFMRGTKSLTLWAAGRIAEVLGLELTPVETGRWKQAVLAQARATSPGAGVVQRSPDKRVRQ